MRVKHSTPALATFDRAIEVAKIENLIIDFMSTPIIVVVSFMLLVSFQFSKIIVAHCCDKADAAADRYLESRLFGAVPSTATTVFDLCLRTDTEEKKCVLGRDLGLDVETL